MTTHPPTSNDQDEELPLIVRPSVEGVSEPHKLEGRVDCLCLVSII